MAVAVGGTGVSVAVGGTDVNVAVGGIWVLVGSGALHATGNRHINDHTIIREHLPLVFIIPSFC